MEQIDALNYMLTLISIGFMLLYIYALVLDARLRKAEKFIYIHSHDGNYSMKDYEEFKKYYK